MTKMITSLLPALLLAVVSGGNSQDLFGAELKGVNDTTARSLSGYAAAGVAVVRISPDGLAEAFELAENDVVLEVNGTRTLQPTDVNRAVRPLSDANTITYSHNARKWTKSVVAEKVLRVAFIVAPEVADDKENEWIGLGRVSGVAAEVTGRFPQDLSKYAAIVIVDAKPARASFMPGLAEYIRKGGGVVVIGTVPDALATSIRPGQELAPIASWFGASQLYDSYYGAERGSLAINVNNPVGSKLRSGDQIFAYIANDHLPSVGDQELADTTGVVARWSFDHGNPGGGVGAFTNRYGEGRVYWQAVPTSPNYPKLQELFLAGIRWAAGVER